MGDNNLDDFILDLAGDDSSKKLEGGSSDAAGSSRKTARRYFSDSDDEENESDLDLEAGDGNGYMGEEDMRRLQSLPEVERERILFAREEKRQMQLDQMERRKLLDNIKDDSTRRSTRAKGSGTSGALNELARRREEKHKSQGRGGFLAKAKRGRESYSDESDYEYSAEEGYNSEEIEKKKAKKRLPTLGEVQSACLTRSMIEKWQHAPFFDRVAIGCFVRMRLAGNPTGPKQSEYRLCEVIAVVPSNKVYQLADNTMSKTSLKLKHGKAERAFTMETISNQPIQENEYQRLLKTIEADQVRPLAFEKAEEKIADIKYAKNYILNDQEVAEMIEKKKKIYQKPAIRAREEAIRRAAMMDEDSEESNLSHENQAWSDAPNYGHRGYGTESNHRHKDLSNHEPDDADVQLRQSLATLQERLNSRHDEKSGQTANVSYVDLVREASKTITFELHV